MSAFPSPNRGVRRGGQRPELVVIHYTGMSGCAEARARLCDPDAEVSAHWLIDRDGSAEQLVDERERAWHAGEGAWAGRDDVNSRSIGIELVNGGDEPFAEAQMAALEALLAAIMARWGIPPRGVIGHSDMAPARKHDPGPRFDWRRLARAGLSVWPRPEPAPGNFAADLGRFGYPHAPPGVLLRAFRLRFRPWALGLAGPDATDRALAADLAARFGVDGRAPAP